MYCRRFACAVTGLLETPHLFGARGAIHSLPQSAQECVRATKQHFAYLGVSPAMAVTDRNAVAGSSTGRESAETGAEEDVPFISQNFVRTSELRAPIRAMFHAFGPDLSHRAQVVRLERPHWNEFPVDHTPGQTWKIPIIDLPGHTQPQQVTSPKGLREDHCRTLRSLQLLSTTNTDHMWRGMNGTHLHPPALATSGLRRSPHHKLSSMAAHLRVERRWRSTSARLHQAFHHTSTRPMHGNPSQKAKDVRVFK